jgi:hypothetical protein
MEKLYRSGDKIVEITFGTLLALEGNDHLARYKALSQMGSQSRTPEESDEMDMIYRDNKPLVMRNKVLTVRLYELSDQYFLNNPSKIFSLTYEQIEELNKTIAEIQTMEAPTRDFQEYICF